MDKPTAMDIESCLLKQDDLTVLTVTHSLNPDMLKLYDEIIYMEEGSIVESGAFDELMSVNGKFSAYKNV